MGAANPLVLFTDLTKAPFPPATPEEATVMVIPPSFSLS
jgi:hypothetical protein